MARAMGYPVSRHFGRQLEEYKPQARRGAAQAGQRVAVLVAGLLVWASQASLWFLLPMMGTVVAYGVAIPNVLSEALQAYRVVAGSAGALFGLAYYLLLSLGLAVAAGLQDLGLLLAGCGLLALLCSGRRST